MPSITYALVAIVFAIILAQADRKYWILRIVLGFCAGVCAGMALATIGH